MISPRPPHFFAKKQAKEKRAAPCLGTRCLPNAGLCLISEKFTALGGFEKYPKKGFCPKTEARAGNERESRVFFRSKGSVCFGSADQGKNVPVWSSAMPMYDFYCSSCHTAFEDLVFGAENPPCPHCGSTETERRVSAPSPLKTGAFPFKPGPVRPMPPRNAGPSCGSCGSGGFS